MSRIVFVWDNFGPLHVDRVDAVARRLADCREVVGLELGSKSAVYDWVPESGSRFQKVTLFPGTAVEAVSLPTRVRRTLGACLKMGRGAHFFMCHYEHPATLIVSSMLRLFGRRVYAMGCSKFDDYERTLKRENIKHIFYLPYIGGISSGLRARDYMRFLGLPAGMVKTEYNTVSIDRIRKYANAPAAPEGTSFEERHFTIVARLVPKKNLSMALQAFAAYCAQTTNPRPMHICGSGPLLDDLRKQSAELGIDHLVHFRGFLQTAEICGIFASSLALLLPSIEEQFGNVVIEAQAMGLPVVLSDNCGARDLLVRAGVNGFIIEPDNPVGMAYFMKQLSEDRSLWTRMCSAATLAADKGDTERFADAVEALIAETEK